MAGFSSYMFGGGLKSSPMPSTDFHSKIDFIQRIHDERERRSRIKLETDSVVKIQAGWRGYAVRKERDRHLRSQFDAVFGPGRPVANCDVLAEQLNHLLTFVTLSLDGDRVAVLSKQLLGSYNTIISMATTPQGGHFRKNLPKFVNLCCVYIAKIAASRSGTGNSQSFAMPLRVVEVFCFPNAEDSTGAGQLKRAIFSKCLADGYFGGFMALLDHRIPADMTEASSRAPTPLAESVLTAIKIGLTSLAADPLGPETSSSVHQFILNCLMVPLSPGARYFLYPALGDWGRDLPMRLVSDRIVSDVVSGRFHQLANSEDRLPQCLCSYLLLLRYWQAHIVHLGSLLPTVLAALLPFSARKLSSFVPLLDAAQPGTSAVEGNSPTLNGTADNEVGAASPLEETGPLGEWKEALSLLDEDHVIDQCVASGDLESLYLMANSLLSVPPACRPSKLLYRLPFKQGFLSSVWAHISSVVRPSFAGPPRPLLMELSSGVGLTSEERDKVLPPLRTFCVLYARTLLAVHDNELVATGANGLVTAGLPPTSSNQQHQFPSTSTAMANFGPSTSTAPHRLDSDGDSVISASNATRTVPFYVDQLAVIAERLRDLALGLVSLAFPEQKSTSLNYLFGHETAARLEAKQHEAEIVARDFNQLFDAVVTLLQLLYERDSRINFCPSSEFWIAPASKSVLRYINAFRRATNSRRRVGQVMFELGHIFNVTRMDGPQSTARLDRQVSDEDMETGEGKEQPAAPLSANEQRAVAILRKLPFTVPFETRIQIFTSLINEDRGERGMGYNEWGRGITARIRRNYLYEDAFDRLSIDNAPNLRQPIRIVMANWVGLDEAGVDGGGIMREFLNELLKTGFDPTRGFFCATSDGHLYPNPLAPVIFPEDFHKHFYFLGRMLGKAIYEHMLVELPFAEFFALKLLNRPVTVHHLSSLDPVLHRNLLYLKYFDGNVLDLDLDFSITVEELGNLRKFDLCRNGSNILVNDTNKVEYIHLVADFYLNRQIRTQTEFFRQGLEDMIDTDWFCMFDPRELQTLISGADRDIDLVDMRANTYYSGGYEDSDESMECFWRVVHDFNPLQRRKLLKFVTSCSRPPLLGFKDLFPPFNIQQVPESNRLPTASTCMNLLKLPKFDSPAVMREKLLYAVESESGFELS